MTSKSTGALGLARSGVGVAAVSERYEIHILDGYTDGKPSWRKARLGIYGDKASAEAKVADMGRERPNTKYRVRKVRR